MQDPHQICADLLDVSCEGRQQGRQRAISSVRRILHLEGAQASCAPQLQFRPDEEQGYFQTVAAQMLM